MINNRMELDDELIDDFIAESKELGAQMHGIVRRLKEDSNQPELFLEFSNIIDRIYGTAMTFGFQEFGQYCLAMKVVCKKCGEKNVTRAQRKVMRMMEDCVQYLVNLIKSVRDPAELEKVRHALKLESEKVARLDEEVFQYA